MNGVPFWVTRMPPSFFVQQLVHAKALTVTCVEDFRRAAHGKCSGEFEWQWARAAIAPVIRERRASYVANHDR